MCKGSVYVLRKFAEAAPSLNILNAIVKADSKIVRVNLVLASGETAAELDVEESSTIAGLLQQYTASHAGEVPSIRLRVVLNGQVLPAAAKLSELNLPEDPCLQLVRIFGYSFAPSFHRSENDHVFKLLVIGEEGVGKSNFVLRYVHEHFNFTRTYISTIGVDFHVKTVSVNGNLQIKFQIWDTAGMERFRTITNDYYRGCSGFMVTFSIIDRLSFDKVPKWIEGTQSALRVDVSAVLVGLKSDCHDERVISFEEASNLAAKYGLKYYEASSKLNIGVEDTFHALAGLCLDKKLP